MPSEISLAKAEEGKFNAGSFGGEIAQSVEQRTENPCVAGSIPALATNRLGQRWTGFIASKKRA